MRYATAVLLLILFLFPACQQPAPISGSDGFLIDQYVLVPHDNSVDVVDISDAEVPSFVTRIDLPGQANTVDIFDHRAYINYVIPSPGGGSTPGGLQVVDVSDPAKPELLGQMTQSDFTNDLLVTGEQAFRARYDQIDQLDVQNPANFHRKMSFGSSANALTINGNDLVAVWGGCALRTPTCNSQLTRYDLADPEQAAITGELSNTEMPGYDVLLLENYALVGGLGVWVTDLSQSPLAVNYSLSFAGNPYFETQLANQGNILYALQNGTLHLLDTTRLPELTEVSSIDLPYIFGRLTVRGDFVYITGDSPAGGKSGLFIVDVQDVKRPFLASSYDPTQP